MRPRESEFSPPGFPADEPDDKTIELDVDNDPDVVSGDEPLPPPTPNPTHHTETQIPKRANGTSFELTDTAVAEIDVGAKTGTTKLETPDIEHEKKTEIRDGKKLAEPIAAVEAGIPIVEAEKIHAEPEQAETKPLNITLKIEHALDKMALLSPEDVKMTDAVDGLVALCETDERAAKEIKQILEIQNATAVGSPLLKTENGKALFAAIGSTLFRRDPKRFAEEYGYGHLLFSPRLDRIQTATKLAEEHEDGTAAGITKLLRDEIIVPDEASGIVNRTDSAEQTELLKQIEGADSESPLAELRERLEHVKEYERIQERLLAAATQELPHLAEMIETRRREEQELREQITEYKSVGRGVTAPLYVKSRGGMAGIHKPLLHEPGNANGDGTGGKLFRLSMGRNQSAGGEVITSAIAMLTNTKECPTTTYVNGPGGPGTTQRFVKGRPLPRLGLIWFNGWDITEKYSQGMERVAAMDVIRLNSDRHANNIMVDSDTGEVFGIDNGLTDGDPEATAEETTDAIAAEMERHDLIGVPLEKMSAEDQSAIKKIHGARLCNDDLQSVPHAFFQNQPVSTKILRDYRALKDILDNEASEVRTALIDMFKLFMGEERGARRFDNFRKRIDDLISSKEYPETSLIFNLTRLPALQKKVNQQAQILSELD